jgi:hypothetical protein
MLEQLDTAKKAIAFAKRGYPVLALHGIVAGGACTCGNDQCGHPGKHPHPLSPRGKDSATTDVAEVREWFREYPEINFGVCTDTLPTIDIDPRNGGDQAWLELVRENYDVHSWRVATGGGGQHIIFGAGKTPVPCGKLARGVDVKGAGGYICGVGSRHASGKQYRWFPHCAPRDVELAAIPDWVLKKLTKREEPRGPRDQAFYDALVADALEGERNERLAALFGHLYGTAFPNKGVLYVLAYAWSQMFCHPPLSKTEVQNVAVSIMRREHKKRE